MSIGILEYVSHCCLLTSKPRYDAHCHVELIDSRLEACKRENTIGASTTFFLHLWGTCWRWQEPTILPAGYVEERLFVGVLADQAIDGDLLGLANPVTPCHGLQIVLQGSDCQISAVSQRTTAVPLHIRIGRAKKPINGLSDSRPSKLTIGNMLR